MPPPPAPTDPPEGRMEAAAARLGSSFVAEVHFAGRSTDLTPHEQETLRKLVREAGKVGEVETVKVMVWSGREGGPGKAGTTSQNRRAEHRAHSIAALLRRLGVPRIETYNLAAHPDLLEDLLTGPDPRVTRALEAAGLTAKGSVLTDRSARAAVLLILREE